MTDIVESFYPHTHLDSVVEGDDASTASSVIFQSLSPRAAAAQVSAVPMMDENGAILTPEQVSKSLKTLGTHPLSLRHTFLELSVPGLFLHNVDVLEKFPFVMYLDVSNNQLESLQALQHLKALVTLNARGNMLLSCLDFAAPLCSEDKAWAAGKQAIGSMLTLADLRDNLITQIQDLHQHKFLECLLLANNHISRIEGLQSLRYLQTLDLSHNQLTKIEGLDALPIRELKLAHNQIQDVSGLAGLPHLAALDISNNQIKCLQPLQACSQLTYLDARNNQCAFIRQVEFLVEIPWLHVLFMEGNPCYKKDHYRLRILYRLPNLKRLDSTLVSPDEKIRAFNLYRSAEGDLSLREHVHQRFLPDVPFEDFSPEALPCDEEQELTMEELLHGELLSQDYSQ